jgi:uncharacterized protein (DUF4415 family)
MKEKDIRKTKEDTDLSEDELQEEYNIDYSKVKRNPYISEKKCFVEIDEDLIKAFESDKNINEVLRSIIKALPNRSVAVL